MLSENSYVGDLLKLELGEQSFYSRQQVTIEKGQVLAAGSVLGRITAGTLSAATKSGGNTGTGTLVVDVTDGVLAGAKTGIYTVRLTTVGTDAGIFTVKDPSGTVIGTVASALTPGTTFATQIKFVVLTVTGHDYILGDGFDVAVVSADLNAMLLVPLATDGSQLAYGVLAVAVDATAGDTQSWIVSRGTVVPSNKLVWPDAITVAQQALAIAQLEARGIVIRQGV